MTMMARENLISAEADALADAVARYPQEACGLVVDGRYTACKNRAATPETDFEIDPRAYLSAGRGLQAVFHSHNNFPHLSSTDMRQQRASAVPWGMVNLVNGAPTGPLVWWGDQLAVCGLDLLERPFVHGCWDCYGLVRDWYRVWRPERPLPDVDRNFGWWHRGDDLLTAGVRTAGLLQLADDADLAAGDLLMFAIKSAVPNHIGIYLGNDQLLHHLFNRLSRREPLGPWRRRAVGVYRA